MNRLFLTVVIVMYACALYADTLTLTALQNATIRTADPATNYNGGTSNPTPGLNAPGGSPIGGMVMVAFDLSTYQGYEVVGDAVLQLDTHWTQTPATYGFWCQPLLSNWAEHTVTWNSFVGSDVTGDSYKNTIGGQMDRVDIDAGGKYEWTVSNEVVQAWLDSPSDNHGVAVVPAQTSANCLFVTRYATWWPDRVPHFVVTVQVKQVTQPLTNHYRVENEVRIPNVERLGLNAAGYSALDSMATDEVLPEGNFEGLVHGSLHYAQASQCTASKWVAYDGRGLADDEPNGWTFEVLVGPASGVTATVVDYVASERAFYLDRSVPIPDDRDAFSIRGETNVFTGGWIDTTNCEVSDDVRAGAAGEQSMRIGSGGTLTHHGDMVAWGNTYLIQMTGTYVMNCWAKRESGSGAVRLDFRRWGTPTVFAELIQPGDTWQFYSFTNTQNSDPLSGHMFICRAEHVSGGAVLIDDWSIKRLSGTDYSIYRPYVEDILRDELRVGSLRHWMSQLGDSLANLLAERAAQKHSRDNRWSSGTGSLYPTLPEFLQINAAVGSDAAWFVLPTIMNVTEGSNLIEFLAGPTNTTYGAIRAARGRVAPWTDTLRVYLELGNEVWDSSNERVYADMCTRLYGAMRASPWYDNERIKLVMGGQKGNTYRSGVAIPAGKHYDWYCLSGYTLGNYSDTSTDDTYGPLMAYCDHDYAGSFGQQLQQITTDGRGKKLSIYEINMHSTSGSAGDTTRNNMLLSAGAAVAGMDNLLTHLETSRMPSIQVFSMRQYWYVFTTYLWGIYRDYEMTQFKRPYAHAMKLINMAIGTYPAMLETEPVGDLARWIQPLKNGVQGSFAYTKVFAFAASNVYRVVALNRDWISNRVVSVELPFSYSGSVNYDRFRPPTGSPWQSSQTNDSVCWTSGSMAMNGTNLVAELPPCSGTLFELADSGAALYTLTATKEGLGTYDHNPSGVYPDGMVVQATAYPDDDADFIGWLGSVTGTTPTVTLTLTNNLTLQAYFTPIPEPAAAVAAVFALLWAARRRDW
jgi:hypothetical protein